MDGRRVAATRRASASATATTAAAAAAAVPERQDGEARVDSPQSEAAGKEGAAQEGAGKEATLFSAPEQGPTRFSQKDLDTTVDLRVFMDPAPHTISELAPMSSVYHMFNQVRARAGLGLGLGLGLGIGLGLGSGSGSGSG